MGKAAALLAALAFVFPATAIAKEWSRDIRVKPGTVKKWETPDVYRKNDFGYADATYKGKDAPRGYESGFRLGFVWPSVLVEARSCAECTSVTWRVANLKDRAVRVHVVWGRSR